VVSRKSGTFSPARAEFARDKAGWPCDTRNSGEPHATCERSFARVEDLQIAVDRSSSPSRMGETIGRRQTSFDRAMRKVLHLGDFDS